MSMVRRSGACLVIRSLVKYITESETTMTVAQKVKKLDCDLDDVMALFECPDYASILE